MENKYDIITKSTEETQKLAVDLAKQLRGGEVLTLYGELGAGKTTFTQGLAKGLGIEQKVISPTFIIMRSYEEGIKNKALSIKHFYHVDLYRIGREEEVEDLGLLELLHDPENVVVIEWPEKMGKFLPEKRVDIRFEYLGEDQRKIVIENKK